MTQSLGLPAQGHRGDLTATTGDRNEWISDPFQPRLGWRAVRGMRGCCSAPTGQRSRLAGDAASLSSFHQPSRPWPSARAARRGMQRAGWVGASPVSRLCCRRPARRRLLCSCAVAGLRHCRTVIACAVALVQRRWLKHNTRAPSLPRWHRFCPPAAALLRGGGTSRAALRRSRCGSAAANTAVAKARELRKTERTRFRRRVVVRATVMHGAPSLECGAAAAAAP